MKEHCVLLRVTKVRAGNQHEPKGKIEFQPMMVLDEIPEKFRPEVSTRRPEPPQEKP